MTPRLPRPDAASPFPPREGRLYLQRRARREVAMYLRRGLLARPDRCEGCGAQRPLQAHHHHGYDVEQWADVAWLCAMCHARAERQYDAHPEDRKTVTASALRVLASCWGARCCRCATEDRLHWDHIRPISRGGVHCLGNLQRLCAACNLAKGRAFADYRTSDQKSWVFSRVLGSGWRHIVREPALPIRLIAESKRPEWAA